MRYGFLFPSSVKRGRMPMREPDTDMMDLVIPYKRSLTNELTYALRSLKNLPHGRVFIIGDNPRGIINIEYIPYHQTSDIASNTLNIMNIACEHPDISEDFIWTSDDIFIIRKVNPSVHHRGKYSQILGAYNKTRRHSYYVRRMEQTYKHLLRLGVKDPLCYELHVPFPINKRKWNDVKQHIKKEHNKLSVYGNLNKIGGSPMKDVKVRTRDWVPTVPIISTHDSTFGSNRAGALVRDKFPEKSVYEL